jgi:hypothetical protein
MISELTANVQLIQLEPRIAYMARLGDHFLGSVKYNPFDGTLDHLDVPDSRQDAGICPKCGGILKAEETACNIKCVICQNISCGYVGTHLGDSKK